MKRVLLFLSLVAVLVAAEAIAQTQSSPSSNTTSIPATASVQSNTDASQAPATTPASDMSQSQAPSTTPTTDASTTPASGTSTSGSKMPSTASPMPLVAVAGVGLFVASLLLSARRRSA